MCHAGIDNTYRLVPYDTVRYRGSEHQYGHNTVNFRKCAQRAYTHPGLRLHTVRKSLLPHTHPRCMLAP